MIGAPSVEQCHVAQLVDQPWNAVGDLVHDLGRRRGDFGAGAARRPQPVRDQVAHRLFVQRRQVEAGGDPLGQLAKRRVQHHVAQFRLADQHQLDDLVLARVDVGQHPQLFQAFRRQVLRFVEDQHDPPSGGIFVDQEILKLLEQLHIADRRVEGDAKRVQHPLDQLAPPALRVRDQPHRHPRAKLAQKLAQQRGLAAADPTGHQCDRRPRQDAEFQHRIGAPVLGRPEQEIRVGNKREGTLAESEEIHVEADAGIFRSGLDDLVHPSVFRHQLRPPSGPRASTGSPVGTWPNAQSLRQLDGAPGRDQGHL